MRNYILLILFIVFLANYSFSQSNQVTFETEKYRVTLSPGHKLFYDAENDAPGLIDKETGAPLLQLAPLRRNAWGSSPQILASEFAFNFNGFRDVFQAGTYNTDTSKAANALTMVTKSEITNHRANYNAAGYQMPSGILNWPAEGDTSIGEIPFMAPFVDTDNNGHYNPENGDYPDIIGDIAVYSISNYYYGISQILENTIEFHTCVFAFLEGPEAIKNSIFVSTESIVRSLDSNDEPFFYNPDTHVAQGMAINWQLGNEFDNFTGCDSTLGLVYAYNGDEFDEDTLGIPGFGNNIPIIGVQSITEPLASYITQYSDSIENSHERHSQRNKRWAPVAMFIDGSELTVGGTGHSSSIDSIHGINTDQRTYYHFHSDPREHNAWNDRTQGYPKGKRYGIASHLREGRMYPNQRIRNIYRIGTASGAANYLDNLDLLKQESETCRNYIENNFTGHTLNTKLDPYPTEQRIKTDSLAFKISLGLRYFNGMELHFTRNPKNWTSRESIGGSQHIETGAYLWYLANPVLLATGQNGMSEVGGIKGYQHDFIGTINQITESKTRALTKVTKQEITVHQQEYANPNYEMPYGIRYWPANGNTAIGELEQMAPFIDINGNGIYEPTLGEYPNIVGDVMVYSIGKASSGHSTSEIECEIHSVFYAFTDTSPSLSNTLFHTMRIYQRENAALDTLRYALQMNGDIGYYQDDAFGTDSTNNLVYFYNGDAFDEDDPNSDQKGFGQNPPYAVTKFLDKKLTGATGYYSSTANAVPQACGDPFVSIDYYNYLNQRWQDGTPIYNSGMGHESTIPTLTETTRYTFYGDPSDSTQWNDYYHGAGEGPDRAFMVSFPRVVNFSPGDVISSTVMYHLNRPEGNAYPASTEKLINETNAIKDFWEDNKNNNPIFNSSITSVQQNPNLEQGIQLFPNPGSGRIQISGAHAIESIHVKTIAGTSVKLPVDLDEDRGSFDATALSQGVYLVTVVYSNGETIAVKFVKQ